MAISPSIGPSVPEGARDSKLAANDPRFAHIFRGIGRDVSHVGVVSDMNVPAGVSGADKKWPLFEFTMDVRTEEDSYASEISSLLPSTSGNSVPSPRFTSRSLLSMNPKSFAFDLGDLSPDYLRETPIQVGLRKLLSLNSLIDTAGAGLGFYGASHKSGGSSYVVTHSIPRSPIISLGALQTSLANGVTEDAEVAAKGSNLSRVWYLRPSISHAISNSFAPSIMPKEATAITRGQGTKYLRDLADHSFLANLGPVG